MSRLQRMPELKHAVAITKALMPELKHHRYAATMAHLQRMPWSYGIHCNHKVFIFDCTPLCVYMNGYVYIFSFSWIHASFLQSSSAPIISFPISHLSLCLHMCMLCARVLSCQCFTCPFSLSLSHSVSIFMNTCPYLAIIVSVAPGIPSCRQSHSWVVRPV